MDEFVAVTQRPRLKKYFPARDLQNLLSNIKAKAEFVSVTSSFDLCRDKKDNFLLGLAKDGEATHLITGDKDLLVIKKVHKTQILTMTDFLKNLQF